ncbi:MULTISPECIES: DUF998 domain-containing protein [unclassified Streptomyces]|uniref:DUF998 domain-containing protein n=1 Tax=unclassified Streptomyces TaxID=2593676 RepID=UPI002030D76F|nr:MULTISPECIES: DUF998 domain-containing protein [unclassified Streptomyces]MCM1969983.1 DUF998 domain-containing protein [Streptomyces sp. G1]MCX5125436.1 DUF998 domain-containing protein [Streptomyces sp. NBC_00347]MCX5298752.1 DUF998 domain-containing protein [Streptomyces sp. NBC_00193]
MSTKDPKSVNSPSAETGPAPTAGPGARSVALLVGLGAAAYTAWVLEVVLSTGLNPIETYVSELAAQDQPLGGLFRATDFTAGLLVLLGGLLALVRLVRRVEARRPWSVAGWSGVTLFGAATAADAWLPLSCTPTVDPECAARETAGLVPATHQAHAVSSSLAMTGALVGIVALTLAARRYGRLAPLARFGPVLVVLELLATAWTLVSIALFTAGHGTWALGAGQRLQVLFVAVWLGLLAYSVHRERRT